MRTGLTKKQKTTVIYFGEASDMIEVQTHNTDLKQRLRDFTQKHPKCCRQTDDDEHGGLTFEIEKGRLSFRFDRTLQRGKKTSLQRVGKEKTVSERCKIYGEERKSAYGEIKIRR